MSLPSNGITQDVIREMMPPYQLSADLLAGAVTALPPPGAPARWRHARLTRLVQEIGVLMLADAAQARLAAQIVVVREVTDDTLARSHAAELTVEQVCRLRRTAADLTRTAATLERGLTRRQQRPAPFEGTVLADAVDIAALDAVWCAPRDTCPGAGAMQPDDGDVPGGRGGPTDRPVPPGIAGSVPGSGPRTAMTIRPSGDRPAATEGDSGGRRAATEGGRGTRPAAAEPACDDRPAAAAGPSGHGPVVTQGRRLSAGLGRDAGSTAGSVVTRLDQGLGWTLDVLRPATGGKAGPGAAPGRPCD